MTKEQIINTRVRGYLELGIDIENVLVKVEQAMDDWAKHCSELAFDAGSDYRRNIGKKLSKQEFINKHFPE